MNEEATAAEWIGELANELADAKLKNRQLLKDLTDIKINYAMLRMRCERLEAELQKRKGEHQ